jgi:hypothetical protein
MTESDLRWLLKEADNLSAERVNQIEAALAGDEAAWHAELVEYEELQREMLGEYRAEIRVHMSPADFREEKP